jgi:hypothetical protein
VGFCAQERSGHPHRVLYVRGCAGRGAGPHERLPDLDEDERETVRVENRPISIGGPLAFDQLLDRSDRTRMAGTAGSHDDLEHDLRPGAQKTQQRLLSCGVANRRPDRSGDALPTARARLPIARRDARLEIARENFSNQRVAIPER